MAEYLVAFHSDWVPELTLEDMHSTSRVLRPLLAEMKAAGILVFAGGLDDEAPVFSVVPSGATPTFKDGQFGEKLASIGGFAIINVADERAAREWSGKIATACGWPHEVRQFQVPMQL